MNANLVLNQTRNYVAIHTNDFQVSGSGWQRRSCSMFMEQGDASYLEAKYGRDQNTQIGNAQLLDGVPKEIVNQVQAFGGSVEWVEESDTQTWETIEKKVVLDHNGETIWGEVINTQL